MVGCYGNPTNPVLNTTQAHSHASSFSFLGNKKGTKRKLNGNKKEKYVFPLAGGSPGRVAEVSADLRLVAEHPKSGRNIKDFNPHGLALSAPAVGRFVTLDYVEYRTTFKPYTKPL
jgi:hypothetical protein